MVSGRGEGNAEPGGHRANLLYANPSIFRKIVYATTTGMPACSAPKMTRECQMVAQAGMGMTPQVRGQTRAEKIGMSGFAN